jgi:hypothetical protein
MPKALSVFAAKKKPHFSPATAFTLSGATTGSNSVPVTYTVTPNRFMGATVVVTPAASNGGTVDPATLTFAAGSTLPQTFTVTRASDGTSSVSISNNGGLTNSGSPISLTTGSASGGDFSNAISGPYVVWYHNFDAAAEVNQFRWVGEYSGGNDPLANAPDGPRVAHVPTGGVDNGGFLRLSYPLGASTGSMYWYRPLNAFTGAGNGRGVDDPGASGTIAPVAFTVSDGSSTLYNWGNAANPGWYGSPTDQAAAPTKYQGNDFYFRVSTRRAQTPGAPPDSAQYSNITGKHIWLTTTNSTYTAQELVTYGQSAGAGDVVGTQSRALIYSGQNFNAIGEGFQPNETATLSNWSIGWRYTGGWDTLLYHITPGTNGGTGSNRTRVEVWAQRDLTLFPAESGNYTKIFDTTFSQSYDLSSNSVGAPGRPGWNALILAIYHNGSQFTTTGFNYDYDQVVFSKAWIPPPSNTALPSWVPSTVGAWTQISGTNLSSVNPSPQRPGNSGPAGKVTAWTGACADVRNSTVYLGLAGGHQDYAGNEFDKISFETSTPAWSEIAASTAVGTIADNVVYYGDGRPSARHNYYGAHFDPTGSGRILLPGGYYYSSAANYTNDTAAFNLSSNTYAAQGTLPNISSGVTESGGNAPGISCSDPRNGNFYSWSHTTVVRFNAASNTYTDLTGTAVGMGSWMYGRYSSSAWDSRRDRIFFCGGVTPSNGTYDVATNTFTQRTLTGAAASAVSALIGAGMQYVPSRDSFLVRSGYAGGTVYEVNASTFACTVFSTSGGTSIPAVANSDQACFNKFLYLPRVKCIVYLPEHGTGMWAVRVE